MTRITDMRGHVMEQEIYITDMRHDLQATNSGRLFKSPLAGAGAYRGGRATGCYNSYRILFAIA